MFRGFVGCGTALVTPFRKDLSLDEETLRRLVRRQIAAGINFLVPCGTTGESPTLSQEEHLRVVAITLEEAKGKVPVLAGAGGYDTRHVIEMAREAERMGAEGILSVTPYYNKPTQEGLYHHYKAIASAISFPIILYNVPPRTNVNIDPATVRRLSEIDNIIGVKEASGSISQITQVIQQVPEDFIVLSGDDSHGRDGRTRNYLRGLERNSSRDDHFREVVSVWRFRDGARHATKISAADGGEFYRDKSSAGEGGDGPDGFA